MGSREENERAALQVRTVVTPGVCVGGGDRGPLCGQESCSESEVDFTL